MGLWGGRNTHLAQNQDVKNKINQGTKGLEEIEIL